MGTTDSNRTDIGSVSDTGQGNGTPTVANGNQVHGVGPVTLPKLIADITMEFIEQAKQSGPPYNPKMWEGQVVNQVSGAIATLNPMRPKGQKWPSFYRLTNWQIATMMMAMYEVRQISLIRENEQGFSTLPNLIGIYNPETGIYDVSATAVSRVARQFYSQLSINDMKEVRQVILEEAPVTYVESDADLVPMNNGIFHYRTKQLLPFSADYVFLSKSATDYNPNAVMPVIHNDDDNTDWDPETWMESLSDDPEIVQLLWELTGAILRTNAPWNKVAFLYSRVGCNGKGTLCSLWRDLLGPATCAALELEEFSKDFMLESLITAKAVISDENPVGIFLDKLSKFKSLVTGDRVTITRKYEKSVDINFRGMIIQCVNELPRFRDRTSSMYRRQLIVPFDKSFTGRERKYIKEDYLKRKEVKEYMAFRALQMDYDQLSEPSACAAMLEEFKVLNDPVRQFVEEVLPRLSWTFLPQSFAYALYGSWFDMDNPSGKKLSKHMFLQELDDVLQEHDEWQFRKSMRSASNAKCPEPLILEYHLKDWMNQQYAGADPRRQAMPNLKEFYRGYIRIDATGTGAGEEESEEETV